MKTVTEKNVSLQRVMEVLKGGGVASNGGEEVTVYNDSLCWFDAVEGYTLVNITTYTVDAVWTVQYEVEPSCENCGHWGKGGSYVPFCLATISCEMFEGVRDFACWRPRGATGADITIQDKEEA